jgi:transcriptional regulator GlxA family with amidase domain
MEIAILVYDNFTALDAVGPYEVLSRLPEAQVKFVSADGQPVTTETGFLTIVPSAKLADVTAPDVVVVPGGPGDAAAASDERVISWLRTAHATSKWTTSVCSGSLILGAAGLLEGLEATTHWTQREKLRAFGAKPVAARVVREGKIITAAGVSAGIDMALQLVREEQGDDLAQGVQLGIEYDPQPPFDAGAPEKAPAHVADLVRAVLADQDHWDGVIAAAAR